MPPASSALLERIYTALIREQHQEDPVSETPAIPADPGGQATPADAQDVRDELNVMFDTWQSVKRLEAGAQLRVGAWLKARLGL
jgi:hypothetical protein